MCLKKYIYKKERTRKTKVPCEGRRFPFIVASQRVQQRRSINNRLYYMYLFDESVSALEKRFIIKESVF